MENVTIPAEYAMDFAQRNPSGSEDDMRAQYLQENPSPQNEPTPSAEPAPAPTPEPIAPTNGEPTPTPEPTQSYDFSKFGVTSEDELRQRLDKYNTLESDYNTLKQESSALEHVRNPFANETIMQINNFIAKTGINDFNLAQQVLSTTKEQLSKDPLQALVLNEAISDPELAKIGLDKLRTYVANKNGVDLSEYGEEGYELPVSLQVDGVKALNNIEKKKEEFVGNDNFFLTLQNQAQEQQRLTSERNAQWEQQLPSVKSSVKAVTMEVDTKVEGVGKIPITLAVSEQEVSSALENLKSVGVLGMANPDEKGIQAVRSAIESSLRNSKIEAFVVEGIKAAEGKIRERIIAEKHNLAPITDRPAPTKPVDKVVSPAEEFLNSFGK
jgi:hypothetical protein